jgi:hypothetical protein
MMNRRFLEALESAKEEAQTRLEKARAKVAAHEMELPFSERVSPDTAYKRGVAKGVMEGSDKAAVLYWGKQVQKLNNLISIYWKTHN